MYSYTADCWTDSVLCETNVHMYIYAVPRELECGIVEKKELGGGGGGGVVLKMHTLQPNICHTHDMHH